MYPQKYRPMIELSADEQQIVTSLSTHSRDNPLGGRDLVRKVNGRLETPLSERVIRDRIKDIRRKGVLILSLPGKNGGYYLPRSKADYEEFQRLEFEAKILDMLETKRAMDKAAFRQYGPVEQMRLDQLLSR